MHRSREWLYERPERRQNPERSARVLARKAEDFADVLPTTMLFVGFG